MKPCNMNIPRVYADTSVFGGCFDEEFSHESLAFFDLVRAHRFSLVISPAVIEEISRAPVRVSEVLYSLPPQTVMFAEHTAKVAQLRDAYVQSGVVGKASVLDAEHIAFASVSGVDMVVSWNFKHIVHFDKIAGYQAVNLLNGYKPILIYSPREVIDYGQN